MELVELTIDKRNGNVCYNDKYHIYWDAGDLFTYISTTTLISKFENFDRDFWLGYKAIQSLIGDSEKAKRMLVNVRRLKTIDVKEIMSIFPVFTEEQYRQKVNELSAQWKANADKACEFGTATHASYENMFDGKGWYKLDWYGYASNKHFAYIPGFYSIDDRLDRQVFPEMLISFKSRSGIRIAGQADICIKDCDTIQIQDYKGLPIETPMLTDKGWSTMGKLKVNDVVYDRNGKKCTILHKSNVHYNPCYKISFDNKDEIIADKDHKWIIYTVENGENVFTTEELYNHINNLGNDKKRFLYIPKIINPKPIEGEDKILPIDSYVLGLWLGDGCKCGGTICNPVDGIWNEIKNRGYKIGNNLNRNSNRCRTHTLYGLRRELRLLNLINNKHIPDIYMTSSYNQRLDLLRGLMDSDGYYHKKRKRFVMNTTSEWQKENVSSLLCSLGVKPTILPYNAYIKQKDGIKKIFKSYAITFNCDFNPFLVRNQDIESRHTIFQEYRTIEKVEPVDIVPTQCIEVDSPDHSYLAGRGLIPTHNTNKAINMESYRNADGSYQMMKYPLDNLMDCNSVHYQLQTSLYTWILLRKYPNLNPKDPVIIHFYDKENTKKANKYMFRYIPEAVIMMLRYFRDNIDYNYQKVIKKDGKYFITRNT